MNDASDELGHGIDQVAVVAFLSRPEAYPGDCDSQVEVIETHVSRIFLTNTRAYKMKRAVKFPYLDFSTIDKRREACTVEININRRTAPDTYLGIAPVLRTQDGGFHVGNLYEGDAADAVEWLVVMQRFDEAGVFGNLITKNELRRRELEALTDHVTDFHRSAEQLPDRGGAEGIRMIVENNCDSFGLAPTGFFPKSKLQELNDLCSVKVDELSVDLDERCQSGSVRHCHGDLHLGNICRIAGEPRLFDAIEFNRDFSDIDVLYDFSFLLMDLISRDAGRLASVAFNRYFDITGELLERPSPLKVLPLFLSVRAAVRSHVCAVQACDLDDHSKSEIRAGQALKYLDLAISLIQPPAPVLIAVGGYSGSGKSRMARELAPCTGSQPGARVVRTDVVRKRMCGVTPETRLPDSAYSGDMHMRTYDAFYQEIENGLSQGHSVIADGVFSGPAQRQRVAEIAHKNDVPFAGIWMTAPPEVMEKRIVERQHNASDATIAVLRDQLNYNLGTIDWVLIDSSGEKDVTLSQGRRIIEQMK